MHMEAPEPPVGFGLRLGVYPSSQILQIYGRIYHLVPAFHFVENFTNSRVPSLRGVARLPHYYVPIRHPLTFHPTSRFCGYRAYLASVISHPG